MLVDRLIKTSTLPILAVLLSIGFWLSDSFIDYFVLQEGESFIDSLFYPEPVELWMRVLFVILIVSFSIYAKKLLVTQQEINQELTHYQNNLEALVSERTKELEESNSALEVANKAKSNFLSSMSHELRTPLNSILGFTQILEMEKLSDDAKESLAYIHTGADHLLMLINDILELSAIESGKVSINNEKVNLPDLMTETIGLITPVADKTQISIDCSFEPNLYVNTDSRRLRQVLMNILSNAVKYNSDKGKITINWEVKNQSTAKIFISDTGVGISEANQKNMFMVFNRLGQENSGIEGTGVGMAVTKDLLELMGGRIGFSSQEGIGTTFWVEVDLA